jgi:hypothetical protein
VCGDFHARGVPSINRCSVSRCWDRAPCSPKAYAHQAACRQIAMFSTVHLSVKR